MNIHMKIVVTVILVVISFVHEMHAMNVSERYVVNGN